MRIARLIAALLACTCALPAAAQQYPSGPVRIIAPSPPGSPRDIRARWVAERLAPVLGQPVIVDNKAGAGGNIGMEAAARSPADGHTLVIVDTGTLTHNPYLYRRTGYDPLSDFIPVTRLNDSVLMLAVHPAVPARSVAELIQRALAVTGAGRTASAPDVPTLIEAGLAGYEYRSWMGIAVPAGTPKAIVACLNAELVRVLRQPEAKA